VKRNAQCEKKVVPSACLGSRPFCRNSTGIDTTLTLACSGSLRVPWFSVLQSIRMHCYLCGEGNCLIKHNGMCKRDALDRLLARVDRKEVEGVEGFWFCIQKKSTGVDGWIGLAYEANWKFWCGGGETGRL
jgi:hypothetical protein